MGVRRIEDDNGDIQTLGNLKILLECDKALKEKLACGIVGETLHPYRFVELKEKILQDFDNIESIKMMGTMKMLLIFSSVQGAEKALQSDNLLSHFMEVRRWTTGEANRSRRFWLEVTGLPLHGWNKENMHKIGQVWERVLKVEEEEERHFSYFRVLVKANAGPSIRAWVTIEIDEQCLDIFVKEDGLSHALVEQTGMKSDGGADELHVKEISGRDGVKEIPENNTLHNNVDGEHAGCSERAIMEVEVEESRVGETQQTPRVEDENADNDSTNSPIKTRTLDDYRRTDDVIQEWENSFFQKLNEACSGPGIGITVDPVSVFDGKAQPCSPRRNPSEIFSDGKFSDREMQAHQFNESDISSCPVPPGFGKPQSHGDAECGLVNEDGRKKRRWDNEELAFWQESEDEIENSDWEAEETWVIGTRTRLEATHEDRARKYLKSRTDEVAEANKLLTRKSGRKKKNKADKVGVSKSLSQ
ncbi:hypothetical protein PIB30_060102 [Stylosanthes scabra]|uniref:DUF4283 domain-containing protein n=1 Tax=Stylosanthes scabra TaxID=79078 RepID=A0ABU6RKM3_9FABA|nr:hypothetical protein [Stylosanthes scabra]